MNTTQLLAAREALKEFSGLEIFDKEQPRSIYNLVPEYVRQAMDALPKELTLLSEKQLRKEVQPDFKLDQMRVCFWTEYQRAQHTATRMNMANVYSHFCAASTFNEYVIPDKLKLAWLLSPPADWISGMRVLLDHGLQVMYDAIHATNIITEKGEINPKVLNAVLRIVKDASIVIHGLPTIRTESKSVNVNLNSSEPSAKHLNIEEKRKELERLKAAREAVPILISSEDEE